MRWARSSLLCALLVGSAALADPTSDAPIAIHKGQVAPVDGALVPTKAALEMAARCKAAENRPPPGAVPVDNVAPAVVLGLLGLVLGAVAGWQLAKHL